MAETISRRLRTALEQCLLFNHSSDHRSELQQDPEAVRPWPGFVEAVRAQPIPQRQVYAPFSPLSFATYPADTQPSESTTSYFFIRNVLQLVGTCFPVEHMYHVEQHPVGRLRHSDVAVKLGNNVLIGEVKSNSEDWLDIVDLVAVWAENERVGRDDSALWFVSRAIRQLFGYLVRTHRRFGFLTTYNYTWFAMRSEENPRVLLISPQIPITATNPSVAMCIYFLLHQPDSFVVDIAVGGQNQSDNRFRSDPNEEETGASSDVAADNSSDSTYIDPGNVSFSSTGVFQLRHRSQLDGPNSSLTDIESFAAKFKDMTGRFAHGLLTDAGNDGRPHCTLWRLDEDVDDTENVSKLFADIVSLHKSACGRVIPQPLVWGIRESKPAMVFAGHLDSILNLSMLPNPDKIAVLEAYRTIQRAHFLLPPHISWKNVVLDRSTGKLLFLPTAIAQKSFDKAKSRTQAEQLRCLLYPSPSMMEGALDV